eukprot:TRINITY_DN7838_c0_g1_i3.p1 TRINITY_DN7838_c0_g1~~TRINITY_DN7838_c0_g1_i3.p1  ORF type:complete len:1707 (-),score=335.40 TRINITY_DN7838_c0_g1_i3:30-5150(-)
MQKQKRGVRPASSARASELLDGQNVRAFAGFSSFSSLASGTNALEQNSSASSSAGLARDEVQFSADLDDDLTLLLRRLAKRDSITKLKALQELTALLTAPPESPAGKPTPQILVLLPHWCNSFNRLGTDSDRRVREATSEVWTPFFGRVQKELARHIRSVAPTWVFLMADMCPEVAAAATRSWNVAFPSPKKISDALFFCRTEIFAHIRASLAASGTTSHKDKESGDDDSIRTTAALLGALRFLLQNIRSAENSQMLDEYYVPTLDSAALWRTFKLSSPEPVRSAAYLFAEALTQNLRAYAAEHLAQLSPLLFQALIEKSPALQRISWAVLVPFLRQYRAAWNHVNVPKQTLPALWALLRSGAYGHPGTALPALLPFLSVTPDSIVLAAALHERLFDSLWMALADVAQPPAPAEKSAPHHQPLPNQDRAVVLETFCDCLLYLVGKRLSASPSPAVPTTPSPFPTDTAETVDPVPPSTEISAAALEDLQSQVVRNNMPRLVQLFLSGEIPALETALVAAISRCFVRIAALVPHALPLSVFQSIWSQCLAPPLLAPFAARAPEAPPVDQDDSDDDGTSDGSGGGAVTDRTTQPSRKAFGVSPAEATRVCALLRVLAQALAEPLQGKQQAPAPQAIQLVEHIAEQIFSVCLAHTPASLSLPTLLECATALLSAFGLSRLCEIKGESVTEFFSARFVPFVVEAFAHPDTAVHRAALRLSVPVFAALARGSATASDAAPFLVEWDSFLAILPRELLPLALEEIALGPTQHPFRLSSPVLDEIFRQNVMQSAPNPALVVAAMSGRLYSGAVISSSSMCLEILQSLAAGLERSQSAAQSCAIAVLQSCQSSVLQLCDQPLRGALTQVAASLFACSLKAGVAETDPDTDEDAPLKSKCVKTVAALHSAFNSRSDATAGWSVAPALVDVVLQTLRVQEHAHEQLACEAALVISQLCQDSAAKVGALLEAFSLLNPENTPSLSSASFSVSLLRLVLETNPQLSLSALLSASGAPPWLSSALSIAAANVAMNSLGSTTSLRIRDAALDLLSVRFVAHFAADSAGGERFFDHLSAQVVSESVGSEYGLQSTRVSATSAALMHLAGGVALNNPTATAGLLQRVVLAQLKVPGGFASAGAVNCATAVLEGLSRAGAPASEPIVELKGLCLEALFSDGAAGTPGDAPGQHDQVPRGALSVLAAILCATPGPLDTADAAILAGVPHIDAPALESATIPVLQLSRVIAESCASGHEALSSVLLPHLDFCRSRCLAAFANLPHAAFATSNPPNAELLGLLTEACGLVRALLDPRSPGAAQTTTDTDFLGGVFGPLFRHFVALANRVAAQGAHLTPLSLLSAVDCAAVAIRLAPSLPPLAPPLSLSYLFLGEPLEIQKATFAIHDKFVVGPSESAASIASDLLALPSVHGADPELFGQLPLLESVGILLAWRLTLHQRCELPQGVVERVADWLVPSLLPLLETPVTATSSAVERDPSEWSIDELESPLTELQLRRLAHHVFVRTLSCHPSRLRHWWGGLGNRQLTQRIEKTTIKMASRWLIEHEIAVATAWKPSAGASGDLVISTSRMAREIVAQYTMDEITIEVALRLPAAHPLRPCEIEVKRRVGAGETLARRWVLNMTMLVNNKDARIVDAIEQWGSNVAKHFEGLENCPICYAIVHGTDNSLPRSQCSVCKNKFHGACLHKWFTQSHKSNCPLCQQPFQAA